MFIPLLFTLLVASAFCTDITNNQGPELVGDYKLAFVWPKTNQPIPNCTATKYSHRSYGVRIACNCGRTDPNIALMWQDTKFIGKPVMFDIVKSFDEAASALGDSCTCEPIDKRRVVALMLNDNLMLQYEQEEILRHYIFAKTMPSVDELREVISTIKDLRYEDGMLVCKEE